MDRLSELQQAGGGGEDIEMGSVVPEGAPADQAFMNDFFGEVNEIKSHLAVIRRNIRAIGDVHGQALTAFNAEQSNKCSDEIERIVDETNASTSQVHQKLKALEATNKQYVKEKGMSAEARIRTNMHGTLSRKFVEVTKEYQEVQTKYKNKFRERVERQYKIVNPNATPDEVENMMQSPNAAEVFKEQTLQHGHARVKEALGNIQDRHRDIIKLEQSIAELHQLFVDMAVLVESQGEMLDQIEFSVSQASNYVGKGVEEVQKARKYQKKARKKMCCLMVVFLVIIIAVLLPVLSSIGTFG